MSTIDLILLGVLYEEPRSAYEITQFVEKKQIEKFLKISKPAIYKSCKRMYKTGYIDGKAVRETELPEKIVYTINNEGKKYFQELMGKFSSNLKSFYFDFNAFLWNLNKLSKKKGLKLLTNLGVELKQLKNWIIIHEKEIKEESTFQSRMIVKQYRMILFTLVQWIEEVIDEYKTI